MRYPNLLRHSVLALGCAAVLTLSACSRSAPNAVSPPATATATATAASAAPVTTLALPAGFVDRVWRVHASSSIEPGMLYVFLSEGTLLIAAKGSKPTLGQWRYQNGALVLIEHGQSYPTDIIALSAEQFTIRSNNPGAPVELTMERAAP